MLEICFFCEFKCCDLVGEIFYFLSFEIMAMKSRKQYYGGGHFGAASQYPAISQAYWAPQPQNVPYSVPGNYVIGTIVKIVEFRHDFRRVDNRILI